MMSKPGDLILICFALKEEAAPFRKITAGGLRSGHHISILLTGIGQKNAEKSLREFLNSRRSRGNETQIKSETPHVISYEPELVLTSGFAGGLNPDLKLGDVVFQTTDETLRAKLLGAGVKQVKIFCADRIAITVAEKKKLRDETGADAVEMESAAIHTVCRERGIPCATVRVISDTANEDLPLDFNALAEPDMSLDFGKLAWAITKSPGKIPALMELQRKTKFAAERLASVLEKII
jgi:uridine phosphorylase